MNYAKATQELFNPPQSQPGFNQSDMIQNNAGGYVFQLDKWQRLNRFLILGVESNNYYVSAKKLAIENADNLLSCITEDGKRVVDEIVRVSSEGLAPKNDPAIFALALCASFGDADIRQYAFSMLPEVCRISTHLMQFTDYCNNYRGWGRAMKNAVSSWYQKMPVDRLAYQVVKYQKRNGWSHRDLLRKSHPVTTDPQRNEIYRYITQGNIPDNELIKAFEALRRPNINKAAVLSLIDSGLTWEMIPTNFLKEPEVWEALLPKMPLTALLRNLGRMSSIGLLAPGSDSLNLVVKKVTNEEYLQASRIHPVSILVAHRVYSKGHGDKGSLTWTFTPSLLDTLDEAYIKSFKYQEPTNKRYSLSFDVSGSMSCGSCMGLSMFTPAEASGALALSIKAIESNIETYAFDRVYSPIHLPANSIDGAMNAIRTKMKFGPTDCALPMLFATEHNIPYDVFIAFTDNETWYGKTHPYRALRDYRDKMGIDAKLIVCAMSSNAFTIADPDDNGMLDITGFDASLPSIISNFALNKV